MTQTFVRYFGEKQVASINAVLGEVAIDWEARRVHVDYDTRKEGDERIMMARLAIKRLGDRVP